jgi:hypothetical protein
VLKAIPKESSAALVLRSIDAFKTKGQQLIKDLELNVGQSPEQLVALVYQALGIQGGVNEKAPVVLAILQGKGGAAAGQDDFVLLLPIADRDKILAGFKLAKKPKDGEIVRLGMGGFLQPRVLVVRDGYLGLAFADEALKRLAAGPLTGVSPAEQKQFGDADLLLYLGERAWPVVWGEYLDALDNYFTRRKAGEEQKVGGQFIKGMRATRRSFLSLRVDQGVRLRSNMVFDVAKEKAAAEMLALLKAGTSRSSARGLADGRGIAALGWAGDGSKNGILTKLAFDVFLEGPLPGPFNSLPVFATTDYPTAAGVTHDLWQRLRGARVALYHNQNEKELGLFSVVAVLDTADSAAFLKQIRTLTKIAALKASDLKTPEGLKLIDVEKLVRELDDDSFRVREAATTRLLVLGEPALPYLEKAIAKRESLEQVRRAERIKKHLDAVREERRKELLLPKEMPRAIRPSFAFAPAVEKREGVPVDVLAVTLNVKQKEFLKRVSQLLGPTWDKMRLAAVGNQVVVLLGSDVSVFERTLANVKAGKPGLAEGKVLAGFERRADKGRTAEMHGSAQAFLGLLAAEWKLPAKLFKDPPQLTSFAVSIGKDRVDLDLWVPTAELRVMVQAIRPVLGL